MATFDDDAGIYDLTIGVVGTDVAPVDFLTHMGKSVRTERDEIEDMPIVSFQLPRQIHGRQLVVHLSALDQDVLFADGVIALLTDDPASDRLLAELGLVPNETAPSPEWYWSGAGREDAPPLGMFVDATCDRPTPQPGGGLAVFRGDLVSGAGVKDIVQDILRTVVPLHAADAGLAVPLPRSVHQGFHQHETPEDLGPDGLARPHARIRLQVKLRNPFPQSNGQYAWRIQLTGTVTALLGPHQVEARLTAAPGTPANLTGTWRAQLSREEGFRCPWMLRALYRE